MIMLLFLNHFLLVMLNCSIQMEGLDNSRFDIISKDIIQEFNAFSNDDFSPRITPAEDPFKLIIQFGPSDSNEFTLWFPELAIFDQDSVRSNYLEYPGKEWYLAVGGSIFVFGVIGSGDYALEFNYALKPAANGKIEIMLEVKNTGKKILPAYSQLAICLSPESDTFSDKSGNNTCIVVNESLLAISTAGNVDNFNHYPVGRLTDIRDLQERVSVSNGYVSRESKNGKLSCSMMWDKSARVDVNPGGLDCIHSHPSIGPLKPGSMIVRYGLIFLDETSIHDHYENVLEFINDLGADK